MFSLHGFSMSVFHPGTFLSILQRVCANGLLLIWLWVGNVSVWNSGIKFSLYLSSLYQSVRVVSASFLVCENWYCWHFGSGVQRTVSSTKSTALTFLTLSNCVSKSSVVTLRKRRCLYLLPRTVLFWFVFWKLVFKCYYTKALSNEFIWSHLSILRFTPSCL